MKKSVFTATVLFLSVCLSAQTTSPVFAKYGYKKKVQYTMSKGEFDEYHDQTDAVEIGSVLFNTQTQKIVGFINQEDANISSATPAMTIDPLCEKYYWISPYAYCLNNPVRLVDPDGKNPVLPGVAALAAADWILISAGVLTTGVVLYKTQNGSIAVNPDIQGFINDVGSMVDKAVNTVKEGWNNQRKREGEAKDKRNQEQANVAKSIDTNISGDMPDGNPAPKRNPNDGGKGTKGKVAAAVVGMGAAAVESTSDVEPEKTPQKETPKPTEIKPVEQEQKRESIFTPIYNYFFK